MPRASLGLRKNGLLKSSGFSSSQTFSSFCHNVIRPSIFLASLITVAKAGGWPGTGGTTTAPASAAAATGRGAATTTAGQGVVAPLAAGATGSTTTGVAAGVAGV